jgi:hypothetical protein
VAEEKRCSRCRETLPIHAFSSAPSRSDGRSAYCLVCRRAIWRERYQTNRDHEIERKQRERAAYPERHRAHARAWVKRNLERHRANVKRHKREVARFVLAYKEAHPCQRCGEAHPACLDFHHRDRSAKSANVADIGSRRGWSIERVLVELAKCEVLCANCHRKVHWNG